MAKLAAFASGRGSNFIAIHRHLAGGPHRVCCLVSDKPDCPAVAYARAQGLPVVAAAYAKGKPRAETEAEILAGLAPHAPDLLALAGYMRLLSPLLVDAYPRRIVNIHPALLPRHPGAHGIEDSYRSGDERLGVTIHYVDHGMDTGPVVFQESFDRPQGASLAEIEERIHGIEHRNYPLVVAALLDACQTTGGQQ